MIPRSANVGRTLSRDSRTLAVCVRRYLIRLGPAETAARRINFAAVWNPCGSILAILAGRTMVFSGVEWTSCSCAEVESGAATCGLLVHLAPGSTAPCPAGSVESGCFATPGSHGEPTRAERVCSSHSCLLLRRDFLD